MTYRANLLLGDRLDDIATMLSSQWANPHRVRAYRRAAEIVRRLDVPVTRILEREGLDGLDRLPGIGPSLARTIRDIAVHGYSPMLERLRGESDAIRLFATLPGIGRTFATRLHDELGLDTLEQLEAAASDGRLQQFAGLGTKRLTGIRDALARRLTAVRGPSREQSGEPSVEQLLNIDHEYRTKAEAGELPRIAPRRFNPTHAAWLPVLHADRGSRHYTALFSNTARAHHLGKTNDWVVLFCDDGPQEGQWTIITAEFGRLRGRRIVRGREDECARFYAATMPADGDQRSQAPLSPVAAAQHSRP